MGEEGRRSPRVLLRLSVLIEDPPPACPARTAVVNRNGALLLSPREYPEETVLRIRHLERSGAGTFKVVFAGGQDETGFFKLGVELMEERPDFWGPDYEKAVRAEPKGGA